MSHEVVRSEEMLTQEPDKWNTRAFRCQIADCLKEKTKIECLLQTHTQLRYKRLIQWSWKPYGAPLFSFKTFNNGWCLTTRWFNLTVNCNVEEEMFIYKLQ